MVLRKTHLPANNIEIDGKKQKNANDQTSYRFFAKHLTRRFHYLMNGKVKYFLLLTTRN